MPSLKLILFCKQRSFCFTYKTVLSLKLPNKYSMSCQLAVLAQLNDVKLTKKYLFPDVESPDTVEGTYVRSYFDVRNRAFVNSVDSTHRSSCACEYVCVHNIYNFCFKIAYIVSQLAGRLLNNFGVATSVRVLVYSQLRVHLYILCYKQGQSELTMNVTQKFPIVMLTIYFMTPVNVNSLHCYVAVTLNFLANQIHCLLKL